MISALDARQSPIQSSGGEPIDSGQTLRKHWFIRMLAWAPAGFGPWRRCATGPVAMATEPAPRLARWPKPVSGAGAGINQCFL